MEKKETAYSEVVSKISSGATIMVGGFMNVGTPLGLIDEILKTDVKNLTIICNDAGYPDTGVGKLIAAGKVDKLIATHIGLNPVAGEKMGDNSLEVELVPQGTMAETIRAGGSGLGGVLTPTGIGTMVQEGKDIVSVDGKDYLLEKPLKADFALLLGHIVDRKGNIVYSKTTRNFNPLMATACETVVVEARTIVEVGDIDPEHVVTPHVYVDYIVGGGNA